MNLKTFSKLIDFLPLLAFFIAFVIKKDVIFATQFLVAGAVIMMLLGLLIFGKLETMTIIVNVFVLLFGSLTLFFQNSDFIKLKPTILNLVLAVVFLIAPLVYKKKPILELLLGSTVRLPPQAWTTMNHLWIGFFLVSGVANLLVLKLFDEETWVFYKMWGSLVLTVVFTAVQALVLLRYLKKP